MLVADTRIKRADLAKEVGISIDDLDRVFRNSPSMSDRVAERVSVYLLKQDIGDPDIDSYGYGYTSRKQVEAYFGDYRLYTPHSKRRGNIEAFGAKCVWNGERRRAELRVNSIDPDLTDDFIIYKPADDLRIFLKRPWKGWSVLYVLNPPNDRMIMNGVALRMDTLHVDKEQWDPVFLPVALKRITGPAQPYEDLSEGIAEYSEALDLIAKAMRGNMSSLEVWHHWMNNMSGSAAGGPRIQSKTP